MFTLHSAAEDVSTSPLDGGWSGTYLTTPPAVSMLGMYLLDHQAPPVDPAGSLLVEEGLEDYDLVTRLDKGQYSAEDAFIGASRHRDFCARVQLSVEEGRVGGRKCF